MGKVLIGVVAGVFVGALAVEVLNRKKPELTEGIERKAKSTVDALVAAFKEGWGIKEAETESIQPEQSPA